MKCYIMPVVLLGAMAIFTGCQNDNNPQVIVGDGVLESIDAQEYQVVSASAYQESVSSIRRQLTDDRQLYEFVTALSLIHAGAEDNNRFLLTVNNLSAPEVIALGKRNAFFYITQSLRRQLPADKLREDLQRRIGKITLPPRGTVLTVDDSSRAARDLSIAQMLAAGDDQQLYELTNALDIISAMSLDEDEYNKIVAGKTAAELIEIGKKNIFNTAVNTTQFSAPAHLLRGEIAADDEPATVKRLITDTPENQLLSMAAVIDELDDAELYEFITALDVIRNSYEKTSEFDASVNNASARELVKRAFDANPCVFLQVYAVTKKQIPPAKLTEVRAEYIAKATLLNADISETEK